MKTILLFIFISASAMAQDFVVTTAGIVSKKDRTKNYVIVVFKGLSADSLYTNAKGYLKGKYTGPKDNLRSDEKGSLLSLETSDVTMATLTKNGVELTYNVSCTIIIEFKEGKVRITYSNVEVYTVDSNKEKRIYSINSIFNDKGKVVDKQAKNVLESHFNATTRLLLKALSGTKASVSADW